MLSRVRPALKSGLLPVWRDDDTLQIGIDPRRAVALTGMASAASVLSLLDGSRDRAQLLQAAAEHGIPAGTVERVLALLAAGGALDDFPAGTLRVLGQPLRSRLAAELATVSLARQDGDGGARTLVRRRAARVSIHGTGRIAGAIASILSTAGVGAVSGGTAPAGAALDGTRTADAVPDGTRPAGVPDWAGPTGASRAKARPPTASRAKVRRTTASRARPVRPPVGGELPDLAVIVGHADLELPAALMSDRTPHLSAYASEAIGVVGPLVVPGRTACLRCLHHARTDRDPAWPLILAQLAGRQPVPLACDAPLAAAVAAQASFQALAFIDGAAVPDAVTNGTLELVLPAWQWRRKTWPPHPACGCGSHPAR
jgi:bacteriocin biosynthesis cyclodehydratase domain-containing protein